MKLVRIMALGATVMILAAGAVACGDDDDDGDDNGGTTPSAQPTSPPSASTPPGAASSPTTAASPTEPAGGVAISVTAADFSFTPAALTAAVGDSAITLTNSGALPHTMNIYEDDAFTTAVAGANSGQVSGGGESEFTASLDEAKTYHFRCEVHPAQMQGTIVVQ